MTEDTTFKEFVEEMGLSFFLLDFGSRKYRSLVERFNAAKVKLKSEEETLEHVMTRARLMLDKRSPQQEVTFCNGGPPTGVPVSPAPGRK